MRRKAFLILSVFLILSLPLFSTDYYVKNGGNDGDAGTSDETAWATVGKVNGSSFNSGDNIYFNRGDEWRNENYLDPPSSGTSGNLITFGAYGTGADPIINGSELLTSASYKWTASGSGTNEYYLEASGGGDPGLSEVKLLVLDEVWLNKDTLGSLADHTWNWGDNDTLGYSTVYIRDDTGDPDGSGVVIDGGQLDACLYNYGSDYIRVENIQLIKSNHRGIWVAGTATDWELGSLTITHCRTDGVWLGDDLDTWSFSSLTINNCGGSGIEYHAADNCTIDSCNITNNGRNTTDQYACAITGECNTVTISNNTTSNNTSNTTGYSHEIYVYAGTGTATIYGNDCSANLSGNAIYIKGSANVYKNKGYNCRHAGMAIYNWGANNVTISIYYNIFYGNYYGFIITEPGTGTINLSLYNNVFYGNTNTDYAATGYTEVRVNDDPDTFLFKNNILAHTETAVNNWSYLIDNALTNATIDHNCVYEGQIYYDGANRTWAYWTGTAGFDSNGIGDDVDPRMIDPANGIFQLNPHSPCINAGTDVSLTEDYAGLKIRHAPDIGAHENQANVLFVANRRKL